jgi:hypothetical protein
VNPANIQPEKVLLANREKIYFDEKIYSLSGANVYQMKFSANVFDIAEALGYSDLDKMLEQQGLKDVGLKELSLPIIFYINAENYRIVQIEINATYAESFISNLVTLYAEEILGSLNLGVQVKEAVLYCTDFKYEPVEMPTLPPEALSAGNMQ